jgi:hypothetical protein
MTSSSVESSITFEGAIAQTQALLDQVAQQDWGGSTLEEQITALVASPNGARGFFVTYLTDERPFSDRATPDVIRALQSSPMLVAELLTKNLAMSTAMALYHRRNHDEESAKGSDQVRDRVTQLIPQLQLVALTERIAAFKETLKTGVGDYQSFLDRWGYDTEQRQAMLVSFERLEQS